MVQRDEFRRTISYGVAAIAQLKRNRLPAYPRHYELWYSYCSGFNAELNKAINDILRERGEITLDEVQAIYSTFLSPSRLSDRIDEVGASISGEIEDLVQLIETSLASGLSYSRALAKATSELVGTTDRRQIMRIAQSLAAMTDETLGSNRELQQKLDESQRQIAGLQRSLDVIRYESLTDELTTLSTRKHFDQSIERITSEARNGGHPFALLVTDIDNFKQFNDLYGHQTGDQVLRLVGLAVKQNLRGNDIACRYGGEEFAIILPGASLRHAIAVAEHMRVAVMSKELVKRSTGETLGRITMSVGVSMHADGDTAQTVLERADAALYAAKRAGRNRVLSENDLSEFGGDALARRA
jgi:diguanylate cyclase